jgi:hypothetical protein
MENVVFLISSCPFELDYQTSDCTEVDVDVAEVMTRLFGKP